MQDSKLDVINALKDEKRLQVFVAIYLSIVLLILTFILVKIPIASDLQQALIIILGLITIATLDAFRKVLDNTSSSLAKEFRQIIVQDGGSYIDGNVDGIDKRTTSNIRTSRYVDMGGGGNYIDMDDGGTYIDNTSVQKSLVEAAAEIQELLQQLEKTNPTASEAEKVAYINEEIEIEPDIKSRLAKAIKAGGDAAIESSLDSSPYVKIITEIIKGWLETKEKTITKSKE